MPRLKLTIEYDGTGFRGWARQPGARTVEGELRRAVGELYGTFNELVVAGRTDTGVHALANVVSVDVLGGPPAERAARALNTVLPDDVAVTSVESAPDDFHARFDARSRSYRFRVWRRRERSVFEASRSLWWPQAIDLVALQENAGALVGAHDFRAFTPTETHHRRFTRTVSTVQWLELNEAVSRSRSPPTRSCVTWCEHWSARCSRVATTRAAAGGPPAQRGRRDSATTRPVPHARLLLEAGSTGLRRRAAATIGRVRFPVVLFDLDGTVIDSGAIILASMRHAAETVVGGEWSDAELMKAVGGPGLEAQMVALDPDRVDELVRIYRAHNEPLHDTLEYCGNMDVVLAELLERGHRLGIVTAKRRVTVELAFAKLPLEHLFEMVVGGDETARHKPDPAPLLLALERLGASAEDAVYVGDSPFDMQAARAAGLYAIGVSWGRIHTADKLLEADVVIDRPEELLELV